MQRLVTGKINNLRLSPRYQRAFTLIEILVVLIIVAIILTVAVMAFGDFGQSRKQHLAVLQLKQTLLAAQAQAILQPAVLGLTFSKHGYHYYRYWYNPIQHKSEWVPLHNDVLSQPDAFPNAAHIKLSDTPNPNKAPHTSTTHIQPVIIFLPNGSLTKFRVIIYFMNKNTYEIISNGVGGVTIEKK